jgi:hypothetical protein
MKFHLTVKSSNAKTGPIPVSTSSATTCPATCPFRSNGCYADSGPLALHWREVTAGRRGMDWEDFLAAIVALPERQMWRHNQAGDLVDPSTAAGQASLDALVSANQGRRGYTYSHHIRGAATVAAFKSATAQGFTVNASCDSEAQADRAISAGLRAVFVVDSGESRRFWATPDGNRVVVCPAQIRDDITCQTCKLCQARPQNVAVAFKAHGSGKKRVNAAIAGVTA